MSINNSLARLHYLLQQKTQILLFKMNENGNKLVFSKSVTTSVKKSSQLERSLTFNSSQQSLSTKFSFNPAKVKLTFLKDSSQPPSKIQPTLIRNQAKQPVKLVEKCVYCIENEYRKEIKDAFNKFGDGHILPLMSKCTCSNSRIHASAKFTNSNTQKINKYLNAVSHSNDTIYKKENTRIDYYYKNIETSLNTKLTMSSNSLKNAQADEIDRKNDFLNSVLTRSSTSVTGTFSNLNLGNVNNCLKEKQIVLNLNKNIPVDINLTDLERIKEKYTNYLLNKEKLKQQRNKWDKKKPKLMKQETMYDHKDVSTTKSISSAINRIKTAPNNNLKLNKDIRIVYPVTEAKVTEKLEFHSSIDFNECSSRNLIIEKIDENLNEEKEEEKKEEGDTSSESENDYQMIAISEILENNSRLIMNDIIVDVIAEEPSPYIENMENETNKSQNGKKKNCNYCVIVYKAALY